MKSKIARPLSKDVKLLADCLWSELVKARAFYRSEFSGKDDQPLNSHHILGKRTLALRYCLDNGVCLTAGEHKFVAHSASGAARWSEWMHEHMKFRHIIEESDLTVLDHVAHLADLYRESLKLSASFPVRHIHVWPAFRRYGKTWKRISDYYELGVL